MFGPVIRGTLVMLRPPLIEEAALMNGWFEDMEVTRFLLVRFPPGLAAEKEWIETMAKAPDHVLWGIEREGHLIGVTGLHQIDWANQRAGTGTLIGDKSA